MKYKITNGAIELGGETILEEINIEIKEKEKIAIIGRNGVGKTTLLKAIINNEILIEGIGKEKLNIIKEGKPEIGYLKQVEFKDDSITMLQEILKVYKPLVELEQKIEILLEKMQSNTSDELAIQYSKTLETYENLGGYTYKKEYETAISKFGFKEKDKKKKLNEFSGGQKTKIAFIKLLLSKPDILLLDEPTNHLDITTIEWLESYLKNYPKAVVIVSHDRMFLDKIVSKIYEIEYGAITKYIGNYTEFERQKRENYEKQLKDYEYQQKEIKRLTDIADRFRYKPTKAKMALSKLKQIEHMVKIKQPNKYDLTTFKTNFKIQKESGMNVLTVKNLKIGYINPIQEVTFNLYKGQKLGIIGENGVGKSTLLKTLVNKINKLGGEFKFGTNVKIGYFDQQMALLDSNETVIQNFSNEYPELTTTEKRNALASFMFYGDDVLKTINVLSGGEKVRLELCKILKKDPNLLILDEPTNHMDLVGKESLELLLKEYKGTIIFVSHDRFFINKIADSLLIFNKNETKYFDGTYEEYEEKNNKQDIQKNIKTHKANLNNEYFNKKEQNKIRTKIKTIENIIEKLEEKLSNLNKELLKQEIYTNYEKLSELQNEIKDINKEIEINMEEWRKMSEQLSEY